MIVLWLIVAHLAGDYLLQTRWQAVEKFGWTTSAILTRARHVEGYLVPFIPIAFVYAGQSHALRFLEALAVLHFLTDAQRFTRTPGELLAWHLGRVDDETKRNACPVFVGKNIRVLPVVADGLRLPPNPWPPIGLAIDQTLHLIQIAVLAQVFLT